MYIILALVCIDSTKASNRIDMGLVQNDKIDEASGIASSRLNPYLIWVHNDSGDFARIYAVAYDGTHLGVLRLPGEIAFDWEDMSIGPGPKDNTDYIYIGDIGNNFSRKSRSRIFRIEEPYIDQGTTSFPFDIKIRETDKITFTLPDGNRDCEAMLVDPITRDIHLITKRESAPHIYTISYPQSISSIVTAKLVGSISITPLRPHRMSDSIVSADMTRDGKMVIIKTAHNIYLINKKPSDPFESISDHIQLEQDYIIEPQGEAVCWKWDQSGYFTLSEEPGRHQAHLYFYPR